MKPRSNKPSGITGHEGSRTMSRRAEPGTRRNERANLQFITLPWLSCTSIRDRFESTQGRHVT